MRIRAFYADPHFGHENILNYARRPFADVEEMGRQLVHRYNSRISSDDVVVWVGDCFFKGDAAIYANILTEMAGFKILIMGNHDDSEAKMARLGFSLVLREGITNIAGATCRLNHFPYDASQEPDRYRLLRPKRHPGEILIHGHSHSHKQVSRNCINVGVDAWNYYPAMYEEVELLVRAIKGGIR